MSIEDKHLEHIAAMQAITDHSWDSWGSPVGISIFFISSTLVLIGLAFFAILVRYVFLIK